MSMQSRLFNKHSTLCILMEDSVQEFLINLFGTLIGAGVGFGLAMLWDRKKDKEERDDLKKQTTEALLVEIKKTVEELGAEGFGAEWVKETGRYRRKFAIIAKSAFESAVNSGNFSLLPSDIQSKLSRIYQLAEYSNSLALQIENFYSTPLYVQDANKAEQVLNQMSDDLKKYYEKMKKEIEELLEAVDKGV